MNYFNFSIFQLAGLALIATLFLQLLFSLLKQMQQALLDRRWHNLTIKQLELAEASIKQKHQTLAHGWNGLRKFKVESKIMECEDVCSFVLVPHDRQPIPQFKPGQHLTLTISPHNQKKITRCYSLSDCFHTNNAYVITVKHLYGKNGQPDGKGSSMMHQEINVNDLIDIKAPKGSFFLNQKSSQPIILLANGVGITPLLAMIKHSIKMDPNRPVSLFYGVRNSKHIIQEKRLKQLQQDYPAFSLTLFFSKPLENDKINQNYHILGHITANHVINNVSKANSYSDLEPHQMFEFYICGTGPMMRGMIADLTKWNVPPEKINYEVFGAASIQRTKKKHNPDQPIQLHSVELRQSGKTLQWDGESSLLELCQQQSIAIDSGCCCGECGTCEVAILSGSVNYPNRKPETDVQEGHCLMCIATPASPLIIDA